MKLLTTISVIALTASLGTLGAFAAPPDQVDHVSPAPGTSHDSMSAVKDAAGHAIGTVSAEMTSTTKGFATAAAISDMYEVQAAKIAEHRSIDKGVKIFAAKMIKGHTQTSDELKTLLTTANSEAVLPTRLDDRHQSMIDELRGAKDADFDQRYLTQQIDAHKEALILMRGYAKDGDTASIKEFAAKTVPTIESHLHMAQHLASLTS